MSITGIAPLDHAPQVMAQWLGELCADLGWTEKGRAYLLLRETLHAIRDLLTVEEAADLAAQLPVLVRGVFFEGWSPGAMPIRARSKDDLLARVAGKFGKTPLPDPERAVRAVLDLLRRHVSAGEVAHVRQAMRKPVRAMWH